MGMLFSAKISHWCENFASRCENFAPFCKTDFPAFSVLVSCILSFRNLTKTAKITQEKLKKKHKKMKNKLETNINLELEKI